MIGPCGCVVPRLLVLTHAVVSIAVLALYGLHGVLGRRLLQGGESARRLPARAGGVLVALRLLNRATAFLV